MRAGKLKESIVIQKSVKVKDEYGSNTVQWTDLVNTRAEVKYNSGNRQNQNNEIIFTNNILFKIRLYHRIAESMRVIWNEKKYRILSLEENTSEQSLMITTELINE